MKVLKYFLSALLLIAVVWSCSDENDNINFVSTAKAPANVSALFQVTQDNTGLVTIIPTGEGAVSYDVDFGDGSEMASVDQGGNTTHTYAEGIYTVNLNAIGITGLTTAVSLELVVSFNAPENLDIVIENDQAVSKQVNVTANADFAITYDVYFGEEGNDTPLSANIGDSVSYVYQEAGIYTISVVVMGAAIETTTYTVDFEVTAILQPIAPAPPQPAESSRGCHFYI